MSRLVPGIVVLIGKVAFLVALYGFLYVVYRGLLAEARRGGRPRAGRPEGVPLVEQWELRPAAAAAPLLRPPPPATETPAQETPAPAPPAFLIEPVPDAAEDDEPAPTLELPGPAVLEPPAQESEPEEQPAEEPAPPEPEPEPEPPSPVAALVTLTSPEAGLAGGARFELSDGLSLGRAPHNDVVLQDRFVSAHHAEIERRDESYVLRDMGSTNGTFRNGARIESDVVLEDGDRVGVGTSVFAFRVGS